MNFQNPGSVSGAGDRGIFADTTALQAAYPAAASAGWTASVGASAPYALYYSNGSAWVASGGSGTPGGSTTQLQFNNAGAFGGFGSWDGSAILSLRNSTTAQAFRVYNTFTDSSNGEWGAMRWNSNVLEIGAYANGTGVVRPVTAVGTWSFTGLNTSGINGITSGGNVIAGAGGLGRGFILGGGSKSGIYGDVDGSLYLQNAAGTGWNLLQLGGTTSSFPALKRSTTTLQARLADDSGFTDVQVRNAIENPVASLTFSTNGQYGVEMTSNTAGNLVYRGSDGTTRRMALVFA